MGCSSSKHALDEAARVRAASNPTTNVAAISLVDLPSGINHVVVESLDPTSLARLGMTCSSLRQLVFHDVDWKWKECHDETWSCGKRSRLDCLPSQRPRSKIAIDLGGMSWREEFARRANLDKMVPALLKGDPEVLLQFVEVNQSDIFNKLVAIATPDSLAHDLVRWMNRLEVQADYESLFHSGEATTFDLLMVDAKRCQSWSYGKTAIDFLNKHSPDDIYDEINCEVGALTVGQVLDDFEVVEREPVGLIELIADCADLQDLRTVLENRKGRGDIIDCIVARLNGTSRRLDIEDYIVMFPSGEDLDARARGNLHRSIRSGRHARDLLRQQQGSTRWRGFISWWRH